MALTGGNIYIDRPYLGRKAQKGKGEKERKSLGLGNWTELASLSMERDRGSVAALPPPFLTHPFSGLLDTLTCMVRLLFWDSFEL